MRHRLTVLALTSVILAGSACGSSGGTTAASTTAPDATTTSSVIDATTTPSTAPSTTVATTPPDTTTTTTAGGMNGAATPEAAAKGLYAAWKAGDQAAAAAVADPTAVTKLFERAYTGPDLQFVSCEADGAVWACAYYYEGGARVFRVTGTDTTGYRVAEINDIAD